MRTATMKQRLLVYAPDKSPSGFGDTDGGFKPYNDGRWIFAERRKTSGSYRNAVSERFSDYRAEYYVYYHHRIGEDWEVVDMETGIRYIVTNVFPDSAQNLRRLVCERKNQ